MSARYAAVDLTPCDLLGVREEIRTGDMVAKSDLGTTQPAEVFRNHVSARAMEAVCLLIVDFDFETLI